MLSDWSRLVWMMWVLVGYSRPTAADVAPPPGHHRVGVHNHLEIVPAPGYDFFLVAFPGPQFKTDAFDMERMPTGKEYRLVLSLFSAQENTDSDIAFLHNHAYVVALTQAQQGELRDLIAAHPGLIHAGTGRIELTDTWKVSPFWSAEGTAIQEYLSQPEVLRQQSPLQAYAVQTDPSSLTQKTRIWLEDGRMHSETTAQRTED